MSDDLKALLKVASKVRMTREEQEAQRRSFAYGNTNLENQRITKSTIEDAALSLAEEESE